MSAGSGAATHLVLLAIWQLYLAGLGIDVIQWHAAGNKGELPLSQRIGIRLPITHQSIRLHSLPERF